MTETERDTHRNYRRQSAVPAVLVAYLGGRRGVAVGPQGLRRAGRADAGPAAVGRGAAGCLGATRTPWFPVEGRRLATAPAKRPLKLTPPARRREAAPVAGGCRRGKAGGRSRTARRDQR